MAYDYKEGKKRIESILANKMEIVESGKLPAGDNFTFENAYYSWVMSIFVDIRNSTELMERVDQEYVAKVVRSFTSEIIEILRGDDREREIGIRGDCVYAIYTTPKKSDIYEIFNKAVWINTYIKMLNSLLVKHGYEEIEAGIGVALGQDHVIKAGRKGVGINSTVWMGDAVSKAAKLSDYGSKVVTGRIVITSLVYSNIIDLYKEKYPEENTESWFHESASLPYTNAKYCSIVMSDMDKWIDDGMPD